MDYLRNPIVRRVMCKVRSKSNLEKNQFFLSYTHKTTCKPYHSHNSACLHSQVAVT